MRSLQKLPVLSLALVLVGFIAYGWLLSVYQADWRIWIPTGAIAFALPWGFSAVWAIAAIAFVFFNKAQFSLSLGISIVWILLMYVARTELRAFMNNRGWNFFALAAIAGLGLSLGWFTDTLPVIRTFGASLIN